MKNQVLIQEIIENKIMLKRIQTSISRHVGLKPQYDRSKSPMSLLEIKTNSCSPLPTQKSSRKFASNSKLPSFSNYPKRRSVENPATGIRFKRKNPKIYKTSESIICIFDSNLIKPKK
jgi:hypothetical protein